MFLLKLGSEPQNLIQKFHLFLLVIYLGYRYPFGDSAEKFSGFIRLTCVMMNLFLVSLAFASSF